MMKRADTSYRFGAGRYIQEQDVLDYSGEEILRFGRKAYVIGGPKALKAAGERMIKSFHNAGLGYITEEFPGYPSVQKIGQLKQAVRNEECDVIVAVGGGRIIDLAKATASELKLPIVTVPTQAATCAAFSPLSVLYTPEGKSDTYIHFEQEVSAVLVDEKVMLTQTPRLLVAGILDGMAKYIEIAALDPGKLDGETSIARHSAFYMAKYTYDILAEKGPAAVRDIKNGRWTKDLHDVVYINIALTGIVSALMQGKGQTSLGHAFNNALHREFLDKIKKWLHGEGVAVGLLAQLAYNEEPERIPKLRKYMKDFGMPCSLKDLGIEPGEENVDILFKRLRTYSFMTQDEKHEVLLREALMRVGE